MKVTKWKILSLDETSKTTLLDLITWKIYLSIGVKYLTWLHVAPATVSLFNMESVGIVICNKENGMLQNMRGHYSSLTLTPRCCQ